MTRRLPYTLEKRGSQLLHQQCWLWGQDIRRPEGNLLLEEGFSRSRPPEGTTGSSQYSKVLPTGAEVRLWGFGLFYGTGGVGIYMNRYAFVPGEVELTGDAWHAGGLRVLQPAQEFGSLSNVVHWIAGYETSVLAKHGAAYRMRCLRGWSKRALLPHELVNGWRHLAQQIYVFDHRQQHAVRCRRTPPQRPHPLPSESRTSTAEPARGDLR